MVFSSLSDDILTSGARRTSFPEHASKTTLYSFTPVTVSGVSVFPRVCFDTVRIFADVPSSRSSSKG